MEFSLLGAAAVAVFCFWAMLRFEAKRGNAAGCAVNLWDAGLLSGMFGILIGRLVAMMIAGINPITSPFQIILIRSGVSTVAASVAALGLFLFLSRRDIIAAADGIAPAALAGLAGWHAGCVTTGGCLGTESDLPWAWALDGSTVTRHPVELYAALAMGLVAIALALWKQRGRPPAGMPAGVALAVASGVRLATEPLRISLGGGPFVFYGAGVVAGCGITIWALLRSRRLGEADEPVEPFS
ncbi:MAG: prolipoprotein diacylglyceryl transferase family protein [Acidimicrobiia bacterium]